MTEIVGVHFQNSGKIYYFSPNGLQLAFGVKVVVETAKGLECGTVSISNKLIDDSSVTAPLKNVIRIMTEQDFQTLEQNKQKEQKAFMICKQKIKAHKLNMELIDVSCAFDNSKLLFYFTSDTRVDFRELVKDLASIFKMRIELRQISVRDEAKLFGGLGVCGREFCCRGYLKDIGTISIKVAKEQGLSLNPTKISGTCGRLMCCLKHEQAVYEELQKITPKVGTIVKTPKGKGRIEEVNVLSGKLKIHPEQEDEMPYIADRSEIEILRPQKPKPQKSGKENKKPQDQES